MTDYLQIKQQLYQYCLSYSDKCIEEIETTMKDAQDSANNETKSSAGDKYETTRSMAQLDKAMNSKQLNEAYKQKNELLKINVTQNHVVVKSGSLVMTETANYFIAIGIGKIILDNVIYYATSANSPLALHFANHKVGDEIIFNDKKFTIKAIF